MKDRQAFTKYELKNGITVYSHEMDVPFFSLQVLLPVGSNHSHTGNAVHGGAGGVAHFLEHLIFNRSEKYPEKHQFEKILFMSGGHWNASTGPSNTKIYIDAPVSHEKVMVEGIMSHIYHPIFKEEDIAIERGVVGNEREQSKYFPSGDEIGQYLQTKWIANESISKEQVFGSDADLASVTPESLARFHGSYLTRKAVVFVAGGHDIEYICDEFSKVKTKEIELVDKHEPVAWANREYHVAKFKDIDSPNYFIGGIVPKFDFLEERKLNFLNSLLTNHGHGPLYNWVRKEKGWSYGISSSIWSDSDRLIWFMSFPLNKVEHVDELRRDLRSKIEEALKNETLIKDEMERRLAGRLFLYQTVGDRIGMAIDQFELLGRVPLEKEYEELTRRMADSATLIDTYKKYLNGDMIGEFLALPL